MNIWLIYLVMVLSSAASMALEIAAGRLLAPYVGMSLYSWTTIIAVVLAGLTIGHWLSGGAGQRLMIRCGSDLGATTTDNDADFIRGCQKLLFAFLLAAAAAALATLFVLRLVSGWVLPRFDPVSAIGLITFAAFFLPSLFVGTVSPLLTLIALKSRTGGAATIGRMYALGAGGAILGTLATGLLFISLLGSTATILSIAILYALLALAFARALLQRAAPLAVIALVLVLTAAEHPLLANPCLRESQYYCIRVDEVPVGGLAARVMALDHLGHGINLRDHPANFHSPYVHLIDELVFQRTGGAAFSAFLIGGGAYTLPRAWLSEKAEHRLVMAEIDPAVTEMAKERLWFTPDQRIQIRHQDARMALTGEARPFDIIVGDAFKDVGIPPHLVTREFHDLVKSRLKPGGLYLVNAVDSKRAPRFAASLALTLRQSFAHVTLWLPANALRGPDGRVTWVLSASDSAPKSMRIKARRGFDNRWRGISIERYLKAVPVLAPVVLTDDFTPVDRLLSGLLLTRALSE